MVAFPTVGGAAAVAAVAFAAVGGTIGLASEVLLKALHTDLVAAEPELLDDDDTFSRTLQRAVHLKRMIIEDLQPAAPEGMGSRRASAAALAPEGDDAGYVEFDSPRKSAPVVDDAELL